MSAKTSSDAANYSSEAVTGLGEEAVLSSYQTSDSKQMQVTIRKGKTVELITISKPISQEISIVEVKSLAVRIAGQIND